jgi:DNA-binding PadR family transcriptional regulator
MPPKRKQQYRHLPAFILLVLAEEPIHGGAIHTVLTTNMPLFKADTGAVYRALQQLELEGEVESSWDTSFSGPARKIYRLTPAGWQKLDEWKEEIQLRLENLNYFLTAYTRIKEQSGVAEGGSTP